MTHQDIPTLYAWLGGIDALNRLTTRFYVHVKADPLLATVFAHMGGDHPATWPRSWQKCWAARPRTPSSTGVTRT